MKRTRTFTLSLALCAAFMTSADAASMDAMRWHRHILLMVSPELHDPKADVQHRILLRWERQAADRDLSLVEVHDAYVIGVSDGAVSLRQRYEVPSGAFEVLLIGKDGHVALRSADPVSAETLQRTIDAMPMRRAGER